MVRRQPRQTVLWGLHVLTNPAVAHTFPRAVQLPIRALCMRKSFIIDL